MTEKPYTITFAERPPGSRNGVYVPPGFVVRMRDVRRQFSREIYDHLAYSLQGAGLRGGWGLEWTRRAMVCFWSKEHDTHNKATFAAAVDSILVNECPPQLSWPACTVNRFKDFWDYWKAALYQTLFKTVYWAVVLALGYVSGYILINSGASFTKVMSCLYSTFACWMGSNIVLFWLGGRHHEVKSSTRRLVLALLALAWLSGWAFVWGIF